VCVQAQRQKVQPIAGLVPPASASACDVRLELEDGASSVPEHDTESLPLAAVAGMAVAGSRPGLAASLGTRLIASAAQADGCVPGGAKNGREMEILADNERLQPGRFAMHHHATQTPKRQATAII
jgi:hypothetical protein